MDMTIVRSSSGSQKVWLPRAPAEGLHGGLVVSLAEFGYGKGAGIPDGDKVVVATGCELSTVGAPFEAADFGGVGYELGGLVLGDADIVVEDEPAAGAGGKSVLVPSHDADACLVAVHASDLGAFFDIPDLNFSCAEANANVSSVAGPFDTADIGIWTCLQ
jgi:hypothetical protein